jgi:putative membrane protein
MRLLIPIVTAALIGASPAFAREPQPPQDFAAQAAIASMFGLQSATLALHKTSSPDIKSFAHRLADSHGTTGSGLRQIVVRRSDIALPERPDERHLDVLRDLSDKQGPDFDKAYVAAQRSAQEQNVALLAAYAESGADPELKAFATKALPALQELAREAKALPTPD